MRYLDHVLAVDLHDDQLVVADDIKVSAVGFHDIALIHAFHLDIGTGIVKRSFSGALSGGCCVRRGLDLGIIHQSPSHVFPGALQRLVYFFIGSGKVRLDGIGGHSAFSHRRG